MYLRDQNHRIFRHACFAISGNHSINYPSMGLHSLGRMRLGLSLCPASVRMSVTSFRREFASRNVIKTLDSRGMLEDVFPKESVHKLGRQLKKAVKRRKR